MHIDDYYRLNACCIEKFVENVVRSGEKLFALLDLKAESVEVSEDLLFRHRTHLLEQLGALNWCETCLSAQDHSNDVGEVKASTGLSQ